ncbi:ciliary microtubule inner protein 2A [Dendrobates tinctorius]|uniref:ciliary microtubule inner protein 2A n=1 Tax=Dendrobates tinctorius TaxID=92724 RepID=UPI003CCA45D0
MLYPAPRSQRGYNLRIVQEPGSCLFMDPYHIPGCTGFCPQLRYQLGTSYGSTTNCLLTDASMTKSPHSTLSPLRQAPIKMPAESPKLQPTQVHSCTADNGIVLPEIYIPSGYAGHRLMSPCQHSTSLSHVVPDAVDSCLEGHLSVTRRHMKQPVEYTYDHHNRKDVYTKREWKPKEDYKSPVNNYTKTLKVDLPNNLQRKAIPGYTGFIPRYHYGLGVGFGPGVKASMDEFDKSQIHIRTPTTSAEQRMKPPFRPATKIYSPAGLLPKYTGFVPGFRDTFGYTYGTTTRQLYVKYPL